MRYSLGVFEKLLGSHWYHVIFFLQLCDCGEFLMILDGCPSGKTNCELLCVNIEEMVQEVAWTHRPPMLTLNSHCVSQLLHNLFHGHSNLFLNFPNHKCVCVAQSGQMTWCKNVASSSAPTWDGEICWRAKSTRGFPWFFCNHFIQKNNKEVKHIFDIIIENHRTSMKVKKEWSTSRWFLFGETSVRWTDAPDLISKVARVRALLARSGATISDDVIRDPSGTVFGEYSETTTYLIRLDLLALHRNIWKKLEVVVFYGLHYFNELKLLNPPVQKGFEQVIAIKWAVQVDYFTYISVFGDGLKPIAGSLSI